MSSSNNIRVTGTGDGTRPTTSGGVESFTARKTFPV